MKVARIVLPVLLIVAFFAMWKRGRWPDDRGALDRLRERLDAGAGTFDMTSITPFRWSRLEIFGPYTDQERAARRLGFTWPYKWSAVDVLDDRHFLVFVDSNHVVAAFELPHTIARISAYRQSLDPESARFIIYPGELSGGLLLITVEPEFESDLWPGEGIPVIEAVMDTLLLYSSPRVGLQPVIRRATSERERIRFDSTRYQTLESTYDGRTDSIRGRLFGDVRRVQRDEYYAARRETTLTNLGAWPPKLLQYRAEGECFVRVQRIVIATECPPSPSRQPRTLWWAWTPGPGGAGWFIVSDSTARVVGRRF